MDEMEGRINVFKRFQEYLEKHTSYSIGQAIFKVVEAQSITFNEIGMLNVNDIAEVARKAQEHIQLGEDFENVIKVIGQLNSAKVEYDNGELSLPSFVTRSKDWMGNFT